MCVNSDPRNELQNDFELPTTSKLSGQIESKHERRRSAYLQADQLDILNREQGSNSNEISETTDALPSTSHQTDTELKDISQDPAQKRRCFSIFQACCNGNSCRICSGTKDKSYQKKGRRNTKSPDIMDDDKTRHQTYSRSRDGRRTLTSKHDDSKSPSEKTPASAGSPSTRSKATRTPSPRSPSARPKRISDVTPTTSPQVHPSTANEMADLLLDGLDGLCPPDVHSQNYLVLRQLFYEQISLLTRRAQQSRRQTGQDIEQQNGERCDSRNEDEELLHEETYTSFQSSRDSSITSVDMTRLSRVGSRRLSKTFPKTSEDVNVPYAIPESSVPPESINHEEEDVDVVARPRRPPSSQRGSQGSHWSHNHDLCIELMLNTLSSLMAGVFAKRNQIFQTQGSTGYRIKTKDDAIHELLVTMLNAASDEIRRFIQAHAHRPANNAPANTALTNTAQANTASAITAQANTAPADTSAREGNADEPAHAGNNAQIPSSNIESQVSQNPHDNDTDQHLRNHNVHNNKSSNSNNQIHPNMLTTSHPRESVSFNNHDASKLVLRERNASLIPATLNKSVPVPKHSGELDANLLSQSKCYYRIF